MKQLFPLISIDFHLESKTSISYHDFVIVYVPEKGGERFEIYSVKKILKGFLFSVWFKFYLIL